MKTKHNCTLKARLSWLVIILLLFPIFFQAIPAPTELKTGVPFLENPADTLDNFIKGRMEKMQIPGLALAVLKDGKILAIKTYGLSNLETETPVTPESVFMIASLSKQFIATAILLLRQEGKLRLEDKIATYLDSLPDTWKNITLQHLLNHTSGIVRDPADYHPYMEQPVNAVIHSMYALTLNAAPGEKWLYSNAGYYILAEIISKVSGLPWDQFITEKIFIPAGMTQSRVGSNTAVIPHRVNGYHHTGESTVNAEKWIAVRPSSAFLSDVQDLAKWDEYLDKQTLLSRENQQLLFTRGQLNDKSSVNYGLGWYVESFLGRSWIHHDGQFPGFRAAYERFMDDHLTVILLANSDNYGLESLAINIAGLYAPNLVAPKFLTRVKSPEVVQTGKTVNIEISIRDEDRDSPGSKMEMEIWDESINAVYKQHQENIDFVKGKTETFHFTWKPERPGTYTINIGTYGPHWIPLDWKEHMVSITVIK